MTGVKAAPQSMRERATDHNRDGYEQPASTISSRQPVLGRGNDHSESQRPSPGSFHLSQCAPERKMGRQARSESRFFSARQTCLEQQEGVASTQRNRYGMVAAFDHEHRLPCPTRP